MSLYFLAVCIAYILAIFALLSLWIDNTKSISKISIIISIAFALATNLITLLGMLVIAITFLCIYLSKWSYYHRNFLKIVLFIITAAVLFLNYQHLLPGFNNINLFKNTYISPNAIPFSLYLNYNAIIPTYFLIYFSQEINLIASFSKFKIALKSGLLYGILAIAILLPISYFFKFIEFDFKISNYTLIFIFVNLIFTCIPEEVFWRGFIQNRIQSYTSPSIAILITSVIFASIHLTFAGIYFAILAFIAGIVYGTAYHKTKKIEVSIICHYMVNIGQFIFFTYPILASAYPK